MDNSQSERALAQAERLIEIQSKYILELEDRIQREKDARNDAYRRLLKMYVTVRGEQEVWSQRPPSERQKLSLEYQLMERLQRRLEECLSIADDPKVLGKKLGGFGNKVPFNRSTLTEVKEQAEADGDVPVLTALQQWGYKIVMPDQSTCQLCDE